MKKQLTSLFLFFALAGGVFAGIPVHSEKMGMMKCCDKAKSIDRSTEAAIARLCCALNCTDSAPTPSGLSFNFSPSSVTIEDSISAQIANLFKIKRTKPSVMRSFASSVVPQSIQPKYIQHHSFLI